MNKPEKVLWGLFFVLAAVFVLVGKTGFLSGIGIFSLIFGVVLVACLIKSIYMVKIPGILFSAAFLAIVFSDELGLDSITPWPVLGAALLGSIGFGLIFHKKPSSGFFSSNNCESGNTVESEINYSITFGEGTKYVNTDDFKSANCSCSFGEMKVYFDNAMMQQDTAEIYLNCSFGELSVYLPKNWRYENRIKTSLADVKERGVAESGAVKTVIISGSVSFGEIQIKYV